MDTLFLMDDQARAGLKHFRSMDIYQNKTAER